MKTAAITLLAIFISVFFYSEVGFAFSEKVISENNDYCLIVKGANLSLTKTTDSTPLKVKVEPTICSIHCSKQDSQNLFSILNKESNHSPNKITKVYLFDCVFLV